MIESTDIPPAEAPSPLTLSENTGVVRAAAVLAVGNVASRLLGLARETIKANLFGASGLLSAFTVAAYVPTSLFDLIIGGMVSSALVPVFSDYASHEKREELWGVVSTVLSVAAVALLVVVALVELLAPQVAWLVGARNFQDTQLTSVSIGLMRLATPVVLFLGLSSILTAALYALNRFTLPAFTGAVFNGTIAAVALLRPSDITSLVWGLLVGSVLQVLLQLPALRGARLRWHFDWRHPAVRRILVLYAPIVAGLVINQLAVALSYNLATRTGDESVTFMVYATTLYQFPLGLVVTALSIATLPTLSQQANGRLAEFKQTLADGVHLVLALILPATAGLLALALPIVTLLFEHGRFTHQDSLQTALVLRFYLLGLPFAAVDQMLVFASYARKDTWRPALVGVISIVIYLGVAVAFLPSLGLLSLMLADAVKHFTHTLIMLWLLRRRLGKQKGFIGSAALWKSLLAALATGLAAFGVTMWLDGRLAANFLGKLLIVGLPGLAGLSVYLLSVMLLDIREAKLLRQLARKGRP